MVAQIYVNTDRLVEVKEGPYYAIKFSARNLSTLGFAYTSGRLAGIRAGQNAEKNP